MELTWGVYAASWDVVYDMYEGFDNIPGMIGSDIRAKGKVTDWKSGFREGTYGLGYGLWDGITGLITEPIAAVKHEGPKGLVTGLGRSGESTSFATECLLLNLELIVKLPIFFLDQ